MISPPLSVWCYVEEYSGGNGSTGLRLREKVTGRKVEMYGKTKDHLTEFLASTLFTGANKLMPNLYERDGFDDYVLVSGGTAVDSYDVLLFEDGAQLTYLLGPTPDTAYRDAFRVLEEESPAMSHSRTAVRLFEGGRYREAVLFRTTRCRGGLWRGGGVVKKRLDEGPQDISALGKDLFERRNIAVHEGRTRVEQPDAMEAILAMKRILEYLELEDAQP